MARPTYPSDLADKEWSLLAPLMPVAKPCGRPPTIYTIAGAYSYPDDSVLPTAKVSQQPGCTGPA
jgi:hypothetical protein